MNINELDSFKLSDAVKFHNRLNPKIWGRDEHLLPEVREKLMAIADNFREFLGVGDLDVRDITISGSNAAYSYTPYSDIDLHLVVEFPADNEVYQELFNAKKYQYNDEHNLAISGVPVELYVEDVDNPPVSSSYSVIKGEWINRPDPTAVKYDKPEVERVFAIWERAINGAIATDNLEICRNIKDMLKMYRKEGLAQRGEFGVPNLVFKALRNDGQIGKLMDAISKLHDRQMSV